MSEIKLLSSRYLVPVLPRRQVLRDHSVVLEGEKILGLLPTVAARSRYPKAHETVLADHVLLPGLINMHTHSAMSLLRGYADDMDMQRWLQDRIWPVEKQFLSEQFVIDGTRLAIAEMLRAGTTCFNELYFFPEAMLKVIRECGIRVSMGLPVLEMPTAWSTSAADCLEKGRKLLADHVHNKQISFALAPHAPYTVSDESFRAIAQLSQEWNIPVHIHLLETDYDVVHSMAEYSERPLQRLDRLGLLNDRLLAVHMTQLHLADINLLSERGVHVIHCPHSNLKLSSGYCPVVALLDAGVNVCIGTDGAASNNRLDLLAEARTASLLAKGQTGDAACVDAFTLLEMLTINAATALGHSDFLGSIEPGKWADLAALDLSQPETQPVHSVISQIAYAASSRQFTDVWVAGKRLLVNGGLTHIDLAEVLHDAETWRAKLNTAIV
jgi:5-methylthioadenosine/S-adenosylhomocysteine deaminase